MVIHSPGSLFAPMMRLAVTPPGTAAPIGANCCTPKVASASAIAVAAVTLPFIPNILPQIRSIQPAIARWERYQDRPRRPVARRRSRPQYAAGFINGL